MSNPGDGFLAVVLAACVVLVVLTGCGTTGTRTLKEAGPPRPRLSKSDAVNIAHLRLPVGVTNGGVASVEAYQGHLDDQYWMIVCRDGSVHEIKGKE